MKLYFCLKEITNEGISKATGLSYKVASHFEVCGVTTTLKTAHKFRGDHGQGFFNKVAVVAIDCEVDEADEVSDGILMLADDRKNKNVVIAELEAEIEKIRNA